MVVELGEHQEPGNFALAWRLVNGIGRAGALNKKNVRNYLCTMSEYLLCLVFLASNESINHTLRKPFRVQVIRELNSNIIALQEKTINYGTF